MSKATVNLESTRKLKNDQYRMWYRENGIPKHYSPALHLSFNLGTLALLLIGHFSFVEVWDWRIFGVLGFTLLLGNLVVFLIHKYPLHRRMKLWSFPYDAHTVEHHRYFTYDNPVYHNSFDFFAVFFPWFVVFGFALVVQPLFFYSTRFVLGPELAHVFAGATAGYFLLYEFVHWTSHLPANHFFLKIPWLKFMWNHHRVHHNPRLMNGYNFCIVQPLFDILFKTHYKGELPEDNIEDTTRMLKRI